MQAMKKVGVMALIVFFCSAGLVLAGDQDRTRDRLQDKDRDGSCLEDGVIENAPSLVLAADRDRTRTRTPDRSRLRDGSCKGSGIDTASGLILAARNGGKGKGDRQQDRKRDGSCQSL